MGDEPSAREKLEGTLDHIIYQNEENSYTVARLKIKGRGESVCITGNLPGVTLGQAMCLTGVWTQHPRFGRQFKVEEFEAAVPGTRMGIIRYLSSGMIKGIGPKLAEMMVEHFGTDVLEVMDKQPWRLREVSGIGEARLTEIEKAWNEQRGIQEIMVFLQGYGLGVSHSTKVYKAYGSDAVRLVKENPYRLSEDIFGIGFKTADRIALNLGVDRDSPFRIRATITHLLSEASGEGHLCLPVEELGQRSAEFLAVDLMDVESQIEEMVDEGHLVMDERKETADRMIFSRHFHNNERAVHQYLKQLKAHAKWSVPIDVPKAAQWAEREAGLTLEETQYEAVEAALTEPVLIITGGPGVGKTTIVRCIAKILSMKRFKLALCAPTGRAAKRLSEATGAPASTIHRLLGFNPHSYSFDHDENAPLPCDVLIADESSMIDVPLMDKLVRAIRPQARLILVGDVDQLPSVGPGDLLRSLIDCGKFRVVRLTKLFRQEEGGGITTAAHSVNTGTLPRFTSRDEEGEVFFFPQQDAESTADRVVDLVRNRVPDRFGMNPMSDVQVLTPMHKGPAGTETLNQRLQEALNPGDDEIKRYGRTYRTGDKVMQIRNNYNLNVFNGDIGFIEHIDRENSMVKVNMDGQVVDYEFDNLDELVHAYCISVHKSQGSEFPVVVMTLLTQHFILLRRNLIYTGITRARKLLVIVGSEKAMRIAVSNNQMGVRYSLLEERIRLDDEI